MKISKKGIDLIHSFEACKLRSYKDPGSKDGLPITVGWGSTMHKDGTKIKLGENITQAYADELFVWEIERKSNVLTALNLNINQHQYDALCSFIYNLGVGAFSNSTLLKKIKINPNDEAIRAEFMRWVNNDGKVLSGLLRRRKAEADLYFTKITL
jgi:lysozyme